MKPSEKLFNAALAYQNDRDLETERHNKVLEGLKPYKGSAYYKKAFADEEKQHEKSLGILRDTFGANLHLTFAEMKKANDGRKLKSPSQEQVNLLNTLKMRESVSETELNEAANACGDVPAALSVIQELAQKHGAHLTYYDESGGKLTAAATSRRLKDLDWRLRDFAKYDTEYAARRFAKQYEERWGGHYDKPLPQRKRFQTQEEFYREVGGMSGDAAKAFCAAVDATE